MTSIHDGAILASATGDGDVAVIERYRRELTGYCYRMLGSAFEAEDAVQETMVRAWRAFDRFEGRSQVRTWLYRIASNVCFDALASSQRRARPMDLGPAGFADTPLSPPLSENVWIMPIPDQLVTAPADDPAEQVVHRESIRLAFVAALHHLPPRQRAAVILHDVLRWSAKEIAELLDSSVASTNSALQRARATLAGIEPHAHAVSEPEDAATLELLGRYVDAFERYDMDALTAVVHEDAIQSMPPFEMWLRGADQLVKFWSGPGAECAGSRLVPTRANGCPAFGQYRPSGPGGAHEPWSLQVLHIEHDRIVEFTFFLDTATLFPLFGLPPGL